MTHYSTKHMHTFCTVVECGGFASAQSTLGMSQPAISTHIRDFEIRLGFQLCLRGRSGFELTEKGQMVYARCRRMLNQLSDFAADLGELKDKLTGSLRIGLVDNTISNDEFPVHRAIHRFFSRANDVSLKLEILPPESLERELLNGHIQLAMGPALHRNPALSYRLLYREKHFLYCGKDHPLFNATDSEISKQTLEQYPISSRTYLEQSELPGTKHSAFVSNMEAQAMLIRSGKFMGFLPVHYAQLWADKGQIRAISHLGIEHFSDFFLIMRSSPSPQNIVRVFMQDLDTAFSKTETS